MKQLQKSDLKVSKIYKLKAHNREYLYRISDMRTSMTLCNDGYLIIDTNHFNKISNISQSHDFADAKYIETKEKYEFYNATPEEKHWLETCIKQDKFVSYEEAMKTFIPEYVECIEENVYDYGTNVIGKIYKVFGVTPNHINPDYLIEYGGIKYLPVSKHRFKPSTKEAYDAQFVVKEPEFVLPDKWRIKLTFENQKTVIDYINKNTNDDERNGNIGMYYGYNGEHCTCIFNTLSNTEITFDQFKQYVLKENTTITEEPKVVLEEPKDKVIQTTSSGGKIRIDKVECSEGGVYRIGDKIKVFGGSKNPVFRNKQYFTIKSFRWSNDKSKICAVTELHTPNGIGLNKIELYVEPKVKQELSLLEQAKLRYPIGTKFKVACQPHIICTVLNHNTYYFQTSEICNLYVEEQNYGVNGATVYYKGKWAEIVEDFVLPEKWCVKRTIDNYKIINNWCNNNYIDNESCPYTDAYCYIYSEEPTNAMNSHKRRTYSSYQDLSFTEITLEQFKKYVLKDE